MAEKEAKELGGQLDEDELRIAFSGPAIAANRSLLTLGPGGLRIAFVEQWKDKQPEFRTAIIMPIQDGISLKNTLIRLLEDIEQQIQQVEAVKAEAPKDG